MTAVSLDISRMNGMIRKVMGEQYIADMQSQYYEILARNNSSGTRKQCPTKQFSGLLTAAADFFITPFKQ